MSAVELEPAWYDNHHNLWLLLNWTGGVNPLHVAKQPWKWEAEFRAAKTAYTHGEVTGHSVSRDNDGDTLWYCEQCPRRHGYDHECCKHDQGPREDRGDYMCCVCDWESPCPKETMREAAEDFDPDPAWAATASANLPVAPW